MIKQRTCVACRAKKDKSELIKVVLNKSGEINIDESLKSPGRGAYVCNNEECIKRAIKSKAFNKSYKKNIDASIYDKLGEKCGNR